MDIYNVQVDITKRLGLSRISSVYLTGHFSRAIDAINFVVDMMEFFGITRDFVFRIKRNQEHLLMGYTFMEDKRKP